MIVVIESHNAGRHAKLLTEMFRLRARVFRDKMNWDVDVVDGMERDKYDDEQPVYIVLTDEDQQQVLGSLRLLPTTGPTLLKDTFSDTLPDAVNLTAPTIWECTRLCIDDQLVGERPENLMMASALLIEGLGEVALRSGIETILGVFEPLMLRVYRRIGCSVDILGCTRRFERPVYLGSFAVSAEILAGVKLRIRQASAQHAQLENAGAATLAA
jgi:acyl homoserine lactone synthase